MANKDKEKALTSQQWNKLKDKLTAKVKSATDKSFVKQREELTQEELAKLDERTGPGPSTTNGFINSLARKNLSPDSPLPEDILPPKDKPFSEDQLSPEKTSLAPNNLGGENPLSQTTLVGENPSSTSKSGKFNSAPKSGEEVFLKPNKEEEPTVIPSQPSNQSSVPPSRDCGSSLGSHRGTHLREAPADEALYSPKRNSFDLLKLLQSGNLDAGELTIDERVIVVRSLKMAGRTQDEIAAMMRVSRSMVVRDYKRIREMDKQTLMSYELEDLGGEIHSLCSAAAYQALKAGKFASVSNILESMTNMLQSMGLVYKAPAKSQVAAMVGVAHTQVGQRAYQSYQDSIEGQREQVVDVLSKMLVGVTEGAV